MMMPRTRTPWMGIKGSTNFNHNRLMKRNTSRDKKNLSPQVVIHGRNPMRGLVLPTKTARIINKMITAMPTDIAAIVKLVRFWNKSSLLTQQ
jgi:hypothetical protein